MSFSTRIILATPNYDGASPGHSDSIAACSLRSLKSCNRIGPQRSRRSRRPRLPSGASRAHFLQSPGHYRPLARDGGIRREVLAQRFRQLLRIFPFEHGVQFARDFQKLPVPRFPDFQERTRIEPAFHRTALIQPFLESLADKIFFEAFAAGVF